MAWNALWMKYWNNNELRLTQPNSMTKQHDKTASLSLIER